MVTPNVVRVLVVGAGLLTLLLFRPPPPPPPTESLEIEFAYSTDADFLQGFIRRFNSQRRMNEGDVIRVKGVEVSSGKLESALCTQADEEDCERPTIWTPASSVWLNLLSESKKDWVRDSPPPPSLLQSPQVLGVWTDVARELGWPDQPISLGRVLELATAGDVKRSADERLTYAHTDPRFSTSGLHAVIGEFMLAAEGRTDGEALVDPEVLQAVRGFERSSPSYCGKVEDLLDRASQAVTPTDVFDVAYMQETSLVSFNDEHADDSGANPLVGIVPEDATFVADYPFAVLVGAPWVDDRMEAAAEEFQGWLVEELADSEEAVDRAGFRLPDGSAGQRVRTYGVDQVGVPLKPPSGSVAKGVQDAWPAVQRRSRIACGRRRLGSDAGCVGGTDEGDVGSPFRRSAGPRLGVDVDHDPGPSSRGIRQGVPRRCDP